MFSLPDPPSPADTPPDTWLERLWAASACAFILSAIAGLYFVVNP